MGLIADTSTAFLGLAVSTAPIDTTGAKLIVVTVISYPVETFLSDSELNTWLPLTPVSQASVFIKQFYCINPTTHFAHQFTISGGGAALGQMGVQVFDDVATFFGENQNADPGAVTSIQPGSVDPSPDNALHVSGMWLEGSDAPTIDSGFTLDDTNTGTHTIGIAHKYSNTAENPTWSSFTAGATFGAMSAMATFLTAAPVAVTTTSLPSGALTLAYNETLEATGGAEPYTWSVQSGSLPTGLVLDPDTGQITGTPTVAGAFLFTIRVTDDGSSFDDQALSITIEGEPNYIIGTDGDRYHVLQII